MIKRTTQDFLRGPFLWSEKGFSAARPVLHQREENAIIETRRLRIEMGGGIHMKLKRCFAGLLAAAVMAGGIPSVSMRMVRASDETPFEPADVDAEQKRKEKEAKEAVNKALAGADAVYEAGQKNYTDASWKAFADAYRAAKGAPADADAETLHALAEALIKAQGALKENAAVIPPVIVEPPLMDRYAILDPERKLAKLVNVKNRKAAKLSVPATVKIKGETYKVTCVGKGVMKNNTRLKKVILGKNVSTIEAQAFSGCKNLKLVQMKGKGLKKIGKQAFKKTSAKLVVSTKKMTRKQKEKVFRRMRQAGMSKKAKIR